MTRVAEPGTTRHGLRLHRYRRSRRHSAGGFTRRRLFLVEGCPRLRQDHAGAAVPDGRRRAAASRCCTSRCRKPKRSCAPSPSRTAGTSTASTIRELTPPEDALDPDEQNTMFHPSEVELAATTKLILEDVERLKPTRVVFDSLSELRLLAGKRAPLSPADSRAQAVLRDARLHGPAARRPDRDRSRPAGAEHRARRRPARAAEPRVRRRSVAGCASSSTAACSFAAAITTT